MTSFVEILGHHPWEEIVEKIEATSPAAIEEALHRAGRCRDEDMFALLSPKASSYLREILAVSRELTVQRFGRTIQLFIPLYLSNECTNVCTYCGFSVSNRIPRRTLSIEEIVEEAMILKEWGFEHLLLVTGEAPRSVGASYFKEALTALSPLFSRISLEAQPLEMAAYRELREHGLFGVSVYQETYHADTYRRHHTKGKKTNFEWRLETPERAGEAGIHQLGLGILLGLANFRADAFLLAMHLRHLRKHYWRTNYSVSFPRLRPAEGNVSPNASVTERDLLQLICAFRIFDPHIDITLSTRERESFRDVAIHSGITSMSAGSRTEPGGYSRRVKALRQFEISDDRDPKIIAKVISEAGYDPVFKDWDEALGRV